MDIKEYKQLVINHFQKFYENVDLAHGLSHVKAVTNLALDINKRCNLNLSEHDIVVAGISHDIFSYTYRDEHHTKAKEYILQDSGDIYKYVTNKKLIACAVGEHRGSYKGEFSSLLSEVISAADRGLPNLNSIIKRIHQCACDPSLIFTIDKTGIPAMLLPNDITLVDMHNKLIEDRFSKEFAKTYVHLYEKYSISGYGRYNQVYKQAFSDELCNMWIEIEKIAMYPQKLLKYIKE